MKKIMTTDELFDDALEEWKNNKGRGTAIITYPLDDRCMIYNTLLKVYNKNPETTTVIVLESFTERSSIIDFLTKQEDEENNNEFKQLIESKKIKTLSADYIEQSKFRMNPDLCITYHIEKLEHYVELMLRFAKFRLTIINHVMHEVSKLNTLYELCPILDAFKQSSVETIRLSTPVEEMQIGVEIPADNKEYELLKYYDE